MEIWLHAIVHLRTGQNGQFVIFDGHSRLCYGDVTIGYALEVVQQCWTVGTSLAAVTSLPTQIPSGIVPHYHHVALFNALGEVLLISFNG